MQPILVTGSGGKLGSALVGFLSSHGEDVKAVSRSHLELSERDKVMNLFKEIRPRLVLNTAAMTNVDDCERNPEAARRDNVLSTRNIAEASAEFKTRLIHFSTDYVFDGKKRSPYTEIDEPNPINVYAKTKLEAEQSVQSFSDDYVIIRVSWLFGVGNDFVSFIRNAAKSGQPIRLATDHRGSPGYIPDLLQAIYVVAFSAERGIFHLANAGDCNRFEMGKEVIRLLGLDVEPTPTNGRDIGFIAERPRQTVLSCEKYERVFGKTLRSWKEALGAYFTNPG